MALQCGIIGLPNVGKSTLFQALTSIQVAAANYPFCTIEPNSGIVPVPDTRMKAIAECIQSKQLIPAQIEFVDIAGLVKGASQGEGLGNQFLGHIRETQAIAHVVRCFGDPNIIHVDGSVDPLRDVSIIETELMLADLEAVTKRFASYQKLTRVGSDKKAQETRVVLEKVKLALEAGTPIRALTLSEAELLSIREFHFITAKKVFYIANIDETPSCQAYVDQLRAYAQKEKSAVVTISGKLEAEISELQEEEKLSFLQELQMQEPGLNQVIRTAYDLLDLQTYFTAGPMEIRAWTIQKGWKAPQAAGVIHSDFEKGFIKAEIYHFNDLMTYKNEQAIRDAGCLRLEGKDYLVRDGDVIHFRFAV